MKDNPIKEKSYKFAISIIKIITKIVKTTSENLKQ